MARVKRGVTAHRRHKAILQRAKGYRYSRKLLFKPRAACAPMPEKRIWQGLNTCIAATATMLMPWLNWRRRGEVYLMIRASSN